MNLIPARTPALVQQVFPHRLWSARPHQNEVFLTFDDGPVPEVTPHVLDVLGEHGAKATFFCVGENAERHWELLERIKSEGHTIGNHTHNHLNGWNTGPLDYVHNVAKAQEVLGSSLFRPPYGRLSAIQAAILRKSYRIVMWNVLTQDYDDTISAGQCLRFATEGIRPGDILVFHDSIKALPRLRRVLPIAMRRLKEQGFSFSAISADAEPQFSMH